MLQTSTNITSKYRQEMYYNYMGNSGFGAHIILRFCFADYEL